MDNLILVFLGINFVVSYLLARRLEKRLVTNGNRYPVAISVFAGLIIFSILFAAIVAVVLSNMRFER